MAEPLLAFLMVMFLFLLSDLRGFVECHWVWIPPVVPNLRQV